MRFMTGILKILVYFFLGGELGIYAFFTGKTKFAKYQAMSALIAILGTLFFPPIGVAFLVVNGVFEVIGIFTVLIPSI